MNRLSNIWQGLLSLPWYTKGAIVSGWVVAVALAILIFVVMAGNGDGEESRRGGETPEPTDQPTPTATSPQAEDVPSPTLGLPEDRRDCAEIAGTEYRSPSEREWFLGNCITPTAEAAATPTPTRTPAAIARAEPYWEGRGPLEGPGATSPPVPLLVNVGLGYSERPGYPSDVVVFTFDRARPGYGVEYVDPPFLRSGHPVDIAGNAFLRVSFYLAAAHDESGEPTIGRTEMTPSSPFLTELVQTSDGQGYVHWIIGLSEESPIWADVDDDHLRILVYIRRP